MTSAVPNRRAKSTLWKECLGDSQVSQNRWLVGLGLMYTFQGCCRLSLYRARVGVGRGCSSLFFMGAAQPKGGGRGMLEPPLVPFPLTSGQRSLPHRRTCPKAPVSAGGPHLPWRPGDIRVTHLLFSPQLLSKPPRGREGRACDPCVSPQTGRVPGNTY